MKVTTYEQLITCKKPDELKTIFIECIDKNSEEIKAVFIKNDIEINDELISEIQQDLKDIASLSDDELLTITGGTTYGDGWDGVERPIVTIANLCDLFQSVVPDEERWKYPDGCIHCVHYSYQKNLKRISLFSGWCTRHNRVKGHDILKGEEPLPLD